MPPVTDHRTPHHVRSEAARSPPRRHRTRRCRCRRDRVLRGSDQLRLAAPRLEVTRADHLEGSGVPGPLTRVWPLDDRGAGRLGRVRAAVRAAHRSSTATPRWSPGGPGIRRRVRNLGVGGSTSSELLAALQPGGAEAAGLAGADIVTVTIGANDMGSARSEWQDGTCSGCIDRVAARLARNLSAILRQVRVDVGRRPLEILVTTYWNVFEEATDPGSDDPRTTAYVTMADRATSKANTAICARDGQGAGCLHRPLPPVQG